MRKMKETGIAWADTIPFDWMVLKNKYLMHKVKDICSSYNGETILSLTMNGVIERDLSNPSGKMPTSFDGYQRIKAGNLLMCLFDIDVTPRCIGKINKDGLTSPAYSQFKLNNNADQNYYYYYFLSLDHTKEILHLAKNLRHTLTEEQFGSIETPVPPIEEQKKIASFLDRKINQIDNLIANEEAQIAKLKEYKQSLITEVVTKGLNPDVTMKDSGVDSIGLIPAHWDIKKAKFIANSISKGNGITKEDVIENGDIQCVRYGELYSKYDISFKKTVSRTKKNIISSPQHINKGDILFACTGELVEEIGKNVVYLGEEPCLAGGDIIVINHSQNPEFLNYAMYAKCSQIQKSRGKAKLKVVHISSSEIGNVIVALPPIGEQDTISDYLNEKCAKINELISIKQGKIFNLNTYKKSLIYEYVTGKREVL